MKNGYVYIMSNKTRTTFYIGVTNNLLKRTGEHREGMGSAFTGKYKVKDLIYYEELPDMIQAIAREKQLKNWHRQWKINLVRSVNPEMKDLTETLF